MLRKSKIIIGVLSLMVMLLFVAACDNNEAATIDTNQDATDAAPARNDIIFSLPADISSLDPVATASAADNRMFQLLFSRLLADSADGFVPSVAESYSVSEDAMTYVFTLREDVYFHNGDLLRASDVVFTFERAKESPFVGTPLASIESVTATGEFEVTFSLLYPFAPFLGSIANIWLVSERAVTEAGDDFARAPIGSGPYKFVEHQAGRSISFVRFEEYFEGPAPITYVTYMIILSPETASIAVEAGDVDFALAVPAGDLDRLAQRPDLSLTPFDTNSVNFITLNVHAEPFDNPLVREAISRAVDREAIITMVADGLGSPAYSFLNDLTFGYAPGAVTAFERDLDRARELLAEAGFPDGFSTTIQTIGGGFDNLAQVVQSNLGDIGINVTIELVEQSVLITNLLTHNYNIGALSVALPGNDANAWADMFTSEGGLNMPGIQDPEIDAWFELGRMTLDPATRIEIYTNIAQRVNDTAAFIPLYFTSQAFVHNADLEMGFITATAAFRVDHIRWVR